MIYNKFSKYWNKIIKNNCNLGTQNKKSKEKDKEKKKEEKQITETKKRKKVDDNNSNINYYENDNDIELNEQEVVLEEKKLQILSKKASIRKALAEAEALELANLAKKKELGLQ